MRGAITKAILGPNVPGSRKFLVNLADGAARVWMSKREWKALLERM